LFYLFIIDITSSFEEKENKLNSINEKISEKLTKMNKYSEAIRPLAYMNEIGEAFRPIVSVYFVRFLYGISWGYIFTDTAMKVNNVKKESNTIIKFTFFDTLTWHLFASMLIPSLTIHSLVKYTKKIFTKANFRNKNFIKFGPTILGLSSIPFIIKPIDDFTDKLMDYTFRLGYKDNLINKFNH